MIGRKKSRMIRASWREDDNEEDIPPVDDQFSSERLSETPYWEIKEDKGLLHFTDKEKYRYAYLKFDGMLHIWHYDGYNDMEYDHDTGIEDHSEYYDHKNHHEYYQCVGDIDTEIERLITLRKMAVQWFKEHKKEHPYPWFEWDST